MWWIIIIGIGIVLVGFIAILLLYLSKLAADKGTEPKAKKLPYQLAPCLLTNKEKLFYKSLKPIADELNLEICPKVRLADVVEIPKGTPKYTTWFNYIKSKHIDFVICDIEMNIVLVIEVDDKSHLKEDRRQRDQFVDRIFEQVGLKILHIWKWDSTLKDVIISSLRAPDNRL